MEEWGEENIERSPVRYHEDEQGCMIPDDSEDEADVAENGSPASERIVQTPSIRITEDVGEEERRSRTMDRVGMDRRNQISTKCHHSRDG